MFIFYVSDFFVCYSFFIVIVVVLPRRRIVHADESVFPPKGVGGSPLTSLITARSKDIRKVLIQQLKA